MKRSRFAALIAGLLIAGFWNLVCAQDEPPPAPAVSVSPWQPPLHQQATAQAWAAFRAGDNETAIASADACIARFRSAADQIESNLETNKVELPTGQASEANKKLIASYQILHDVATCFLIKGWAAEKLGRKAEARKAYDAATKYAQARTTDENGDSFWSPAKAASEHLAALTKESTP